MLFLKKASLRARGSAADQHDGLPPAGMGLCGAASGGTAQLPLAATSVRAAGEVPAEPASFRGCLM